MSDESERSNWAEKEDLTLEMPFVVVQSVGGRFDDDAFVVGWQGGEISARLAAANLAGATAVRVEMVHTALLPQLELVGMRQGFPTMRADVSEEYPDWAIVSFLSGGHGGGDS